MSYTDGYLEHSRFGGVSWRDTGQQFAVERTRGSSKDPEFSKFFWHPNRFGVQLAPRDFLAKLQTIHPDLHCTWHPLMERWLVWYKRDRVSHYLCKGWLLLFIVQDEKERFIPLDERALAAVWECSANFDGRWGGSVAYFDRIMAEKKRDEDRQRAAYTNRNHAAIGERWDYTLIKNIGHGSKFANHHSGN